MTTPRRPRRHRPALAAATTALALGALAACGEDAGDTATDPASPTATTSEPAAEESSPEESSAAGPCEYPTDGTEPAREVTPPPAEPTVSGEVDVTIVTSAGEIAATLTADRTPCTVGNFVSLAQQDWFDDTQCHRLTTQGIYVLQCGDPTGTGTGGPGYTIPDEVDGSEKYPAGTLAMAKTMMPDSGGSQFFMVYDDSSVLPPDYTVFGQIDEQGIELLQEIAAEGVKGNAGDGPPAQEVVIEDVVVE